MNRATSLKLLVLGALLACASATSSGCLLGCPLAAASGEPYGMTRDDWSALEGKRGPIWGEREPFAIIDLPFAFVLDTAFLPIAIVTWAILGGEEERPHRHRDGDDGDDRDRDDDAVDPGSDHGHGHDRDDDGGDPGHDRDDGGPAPPDDAARDGGGRGTG